MANAIKKLAGETAIYGLSTILARMINFLIVPLYTRVLSTESYGAYAEIMSYIAVLQVVLVFGLETGCFKFANNIRNAQSARDNNSRALPNPETPFSTALGTVISTSGIFFLLMLIFAGPLSNAMGYGLYPKMVIYAGAILALDSVTAILFARLRYQQKAFKFAIFKTIKIVSELGFNLLLFLTLPSYLAANPGSWITGFIPAEPNFVYIVFAVMLSCIICTLLFIPDLLKVKITINNKLLKQMLTYSLPLMIAGLPGILNDSLDRILFRFFAPEGALWRSDLGVYQAAVRLAVIMNLFVQMFRYAAEPFFFAREKERGSKEMYAKVMEYFVAFCMLIFLGVLLYMDIIGLLLGKDFRGALDTVPLMLISYMLLGILFNVSMWYKLSGHTRYAINITLAGLAVTALINIIFMPHFSYWASVWAHVLSGLAMLLYSLWLGNKYYPIPYKWKTICSYIYAGIFIFLAISTINNILEAKTTLTNGWLLAIRLTDGTIGILIYVTYVISKNKSLLTLFKK
ncbi:MAG: polysaccharide biosynthesis protein [Bacteroidales bacterium]|nr:polysaccharide biosynthesis protein [Bacteroidales bacterium]